MKRVLFFAALISLACTNENNANPNLIADQSLSEPTVQLNSEEDPALEFQELGASLYEGTMDESNSIWLYINEQEDPCGGDRTFIDAMYSYDQERWILLAVTVDRQKNNYCFVEVNFSGALFLAASGNKLNGTWISPDTKKQLSVKLKKTNLDAITDEKMQEMLFDNLLYNENDC